MTRSVFTSASTVPHSVLHYLIEAGDREEAELILEEEIARERFLHPTEKIERCTHNMPAWCRRGDLRGDTERSRC